MPINKIGPPIAYMTVSPLLSMLAPKSGSPNRKPTSNSVLDTTTATPIFESRARAHANGNDPRNTEPAKAFGAATFGDGVRRKSEEGRKQNRLGKAVQHADEVEPWSHAWERHGLAKASGEAQQEGRDEELCFASLCSHGAQVPCVSNVVLMRSMASCGSVTPEALQFSSSCSGRVAPTITLATPGSRRHQASAS